MRMESEFYISEQNVYLYSKIAGDIVSFVQYGTSKELNEINEGYPVLRLNEFESVFISKPAKYCNLLDEDDYISLKLRKDDVLICRTNGNPKLVGKSALVPKDYEYAFASYLFRVRPNRKYIYPATLVSYVDSTSMEVSPIRLEIQSAVSISLMPRVIRAPQLFRIVGQVSR